MNAVRWLVKWLPWLNAALWLVIFYFIPDNDHCHGLRDAFGFLWLLHPSKPFGFLLRGNKYHWKPDQMVFEEKTVMVQLGMTVRSDPSHQYNLGVLVIQANTCDKMDCPILFIFCYTAPSYGLYHKCYGIEVNIKNATNNSLSHLQWLHLCCTLNK